MTLDPDRLAEGAKSGSNGDVAAEMRLRGSLPRVTRISRKVLVGAGLVSGMVVGGALIHALQAPDRQLRTDELVTTERRQTADGLQNLPRDYTGVPLLGPPLPGDLGMPIVRAREEGRPVPAETLPVPHADPEAQRLLAEGEAARTSQLFVQVRSPASDGNVQTSPLPGSVAMPGAASGAGERHMTFLNAPIDRRIVAPDRLMPPVSPFLLQAGSVIPAALTTGIRSDLPGQITAQVTQNVYDSPTGAFLLIPQGTRIIGEYDSNVAVGQRRVLLVWNRLILPDGRSIVLERQPGADGQGYAGLEDGVDHHWWDLARAAGLSTLLSVGAELAVSDEDRLLRAIRDGAQGTINDAGQQIIQRQLQRAPTLTIRPGFPVRVMVTRDLVLG